MGHATCDRRLVVFRESKAIDGLRLTKSSLITLKKGQLEYIWHNKTSKKPLCIVFHGGHSNCFESLGVEEIHAAGFSALIPSRPGYGRTSSNIGTTAIETADSIAEFLDALDISNVSVLAISAGGPSALNFVARHPERINKLVLESAVTKRWLNPDDDLYKAARRIFHPSTQHLTWFMLKTFVKLTPSLIFRKMIPSFSKLDANEALNSLSIKDKEAFKIMLLNLWSGSGFVLDIDHVIDTAVLQRIKSPTLIVHSRNDNSVSFEHAKHAQKNIEKAELFVAQTWGHLIWLGKGSCEVKTKIDEFLRD